MPTGTGAPDAKEQGASALVATFVFVVHGVDAGSAACLDRAVLLARRSPSDLSDPIGPRWLEEAARDTTALGSYTVLGLIVAAAATYLVVTRRRGLA